MSCTNERLISDITVTLAGVPTITGATVSGNSVCISYANEGALLLAVDTAAVYAKDTAAVYARASPA